MQAILFVVFFLDESPLIPHDQAMPDAQMPTAEQIARLAKERGLSIAALCRRADIDSATFYRWKKGKLPSGRIIQKMIDVIAATPTAA